jgi:hypothetical protein
VRVSPPSGLLLVRVYPFDPHHGLSFWGSALCPAFPFLAKKNGEKHRFTEPRIGIMAKPSLCPPASRQGCVCLACSRSCMIAPPALWQKIQRSTSNLFTFVGAKLEAKIPPNSMAVVHPAGMADSTVKTMLGRMPRGIRVTILFYVFSAQAQQDRTGRFLAPMGAPGDGVFFADGEPSLTLRLPSTDSGSIRSSQSTLAGTASQTRSPGMSCSAIALGTTLRSLRCGRILRG